MKKTGSIKCPKCGYPLQNPVSQAGGKAKVSKGFASPEVMAKALATRAANKAKLETGETP